MKKFTKLMLATVAVTAVSAAMAVSALAADTIKGQYDAATGVVTLEGVVSSGEQQTLLVLTENTDVTDDNADEIIAQIDQEASITTFKLPTDPTKLKDTYYIRIGGSNGKIQTGTLTISGGGGTHEVLIGDVDQNGKVSSGDASIILETVANEDELTGDALIAAQKCSGDDTRVSSGDASEILDFVANEEHERVNTKYTVAD